MRAAPLAALLLFTPLPALAQADPAVTAETERVKAETELEKAKTERIKADNERIKALGIPTFEGKTDLGTGGGTMEATLLSAEAMGVAADMIASHSAMKDKEVILLTKDEQLDIGLAATVRAEMEAINTLYTRAKVDDPAQLGGSLNPLSAITAVAGLLRSDVTYSFAEAAAIDDRMLSWTVAQRLGANAMLPSAKIGGAPGTHGEALFKSFNQLEQRRSLAADRRDVLAAIKTPSEAEKAELASINAAITRHDAFTARVTAVNDKGLVPLLAAARLADLFAPDTLVLRLHVDKAGGSLVNRKNIVSFFGGDALRVSGAVVVSWILTDPDKGSVLAADVLTCRTSSTTIPKVQRFAAGTTGAVCRSVLPPRN